MRSCADSASSVPGEPRFRSLPMANCSMAQQRASIGLRRLKNFVKLVHLLPALSLPESAAEAYGAIRADLESKGEMIGNNDLWIAAHAVVARLTLVTNNESEFRQVRGLRIQNWAV
jgi:predicted nucleic acid-binding protein